ncbi:unnamed protein product, partial [marine sediment metagenome]
GTGKQKNWKGFGLDAPPPPPHNGRSILTITWLVGFLYSPSHKDSENV